MVVPDLCTGARKIRARISGWFHDMKSYGGNIHLNRELTKDPSEILSVSNIESRFLVMKGKKKEEETMI